MAARPRTPFGRRNRLALLRASSDSGQSLVLVLMISVLTFLLVITATTGVVAQIQPARISLDDAAATSAAESGLEDFVSQVNLHCVVVLQCSWLAGMPSNSGTVQGTSSGSANESFQWQITSLDNDSGKVRIKSVGKVPLHGTSAPYRTKTLVADIEGTPGFPDFQYYTTFETLSSDYLTNLYQPRRINVTLASNDNTFQATQIASAGTPGPGVLTWTGSSSNGTSIAAQTKICEDLYQGSAATGPGRTSTGTYPNSPYFAGSDFAWYTEQGTWAPTSGSSASVTHADACDVAFEAGMIMNGPIYTQDAYLLDSYKASGSSCSSNTNQNPTFNAHSVAGRTDLAYSLFQGTPATLQPNGNYYRTYATYGETNGNGGVAATTDTNGDGCNKFPQRTTQAISLPDTTAKAKDHGPCVYTGPTRIQIVNQTVYVTSPQTPAIAGSRCYNSDPTYSNYNGSTGVVHAAVPLDHLIVYVQNPTTAGHPTATAANRIFDVRSNQAAPALAGADGLAGTWTGSYYSTTPCPLTPVDPTKRRNFDCETGTTAGSAKEDVFTGITTAVDNALKTAASTPAAFATSLQQLIAGKMGGATLVTAAPTTLTVGQVKYQVTVTAGATGAPQNHVAPSLAASDPFFQSTPGGYTTTTQPWTVTITRYSCPGTKTCDGHGNDPSPTTTPIVNGSTVSQTTATAATNSKSQFPWFGTGQTDPANDVTQYQDNWGDAYVEGTVQGNLSVVAEHDVVLTNAVSYSNTNTSTTTDGAAYIAGHNVRVYRPLSCVTADPAGAAQPTSAGWCPNDLSGADTSPSPKWTSTYPPSQQYKESTAPSLSQGKTKNSSSSIYGLFFSLGTRDSTGNRVGGSFLVDNVARGPDNGTLQLTGGLYQYHRGITKMQWKDNPGGASIARPGMSLTFNYDNVRVGQQANGSSRVPWVPTPSGKNGIRTWNVVGLSTGS